MNTDKDIELHELEAIEQRLNMDGGVGPVNNDGSAATSGRTFAITSDSGFESS